MKRRAAWTAALSETPLFGKPLPVPKVVKPRPFRLTPTEAPESDVLPSVLHALQWHPKVAKAWRQNTGAGKLLSKDGKTSRFIRFGFPGQPDIGGYMRDGRALYVETKRKSGVASDDQKTFIEEAAENGCVAFVARGVADVFAMMERV